MNSKIIAFDIGDQWTGIAISDATKIFARPYKTVASLDLKKTIEEIQNNETIEAYVIGYPKTMKGTESEQTKKVLLEKEKLEKIFPELKFILWDERLSSKRAEMTKQAKTKEEKLQSHARAAAFILDSYLQFLSNQS